MYDSDQSTKSMSKIQKEKKEEKGNRSDTFAIMIRREMKEIKIIFFEKEFKMINERLIMKIITMLHQRE
mgnify:FL=1